MFLPVMEALGSLLRRFGHDRDLPHEPADCSLGADPLSDPAEAWDRTPEPPLTDYELIGLRQLLEERRQRLVNEAIRIT